MAGWVLLHGLTAEGVVVGDLVPGGLDEVGVDFGPGVGLWVLNLPEMMTAGRFH